MELGIVAAIVASCVIFGVKKLPEIARNFGRAQGEFKKGLKEGAVDDDGGVHRAEERVLVRSGVHLGPASRFPADPAPGRSARGSRSRTVVTRRTTAPSPPPPPR